MTTTQACTVLVVGKISRRRRNDKGSHFTLVTMPAPDAYSHPQTVEISSRRSLGAVGDEVSVSCHLGGAVRSYDGKDDDGQPARVFTADNRLYAVEAH